MEKLKRYNQILLAILGSAVVLFAIGIGIFALVDSMIDHRHPRIGEDGVRINAAKNDSIADQNMRYQEITYLSPMQLDSGIATYIIPVSQVNLKTPENIRRQKNPKLNGLLNLYSASAFEYQNYYGYFNNFLVYNADTDAQYSIFSSRVSINNWVNMNFNKQRILLFKGTNADSNSDGFLNQDDYQKLFVFHLKNRKLYPIDIPQTTVEAFELMPETDLIYLRVGEDKNQDGEFDELREPYRIYTYNVTTHKTKELVSQEMQKKLQEVIE